VRASIPMWTNNHQRYLPHSVRPKFIFCIVCVLAIFAPRLRAQESDEFDSYRLKLGGFWLYSSPSGTIESSVENGAIDLQKDLGFNSYSTGAGKIDWKFTHKNHFYLVGVAFNSSRQVVLYRTITFKNETFEAGLTTQSKLSSPMYAPGYQYDIIRRKRGHLGLAVQCNLFDAHASISAAAQVTGDGVHHAAVSASASLLAPIPVAGPEVRYYLTDSPRVYVEGNVYGMYFFGYGNFVSSAGDLGFTINKHLSVNAGYQLGSRLVVTSDASTNRIGLRLTQNGPIVGAEISF
jgi:hypothetical protein